MRYVVLGAGVGKAIAYFLSKLHSTSKLVLVDSDLERASKACQMINKSTPHALCTPTNLHFDHISTSFLSKYDVIVSAFPAKYNYALADKAIDAGVNFCDLGGVVDITEKMISGLNEKAERNCVSVIPDCGVMPGLGIMLARIFVDEFRKVESAYIYVGGIPQKPSPPLFYQKVFNIDGVESICYDRAPVLQDNEIVVREPFSDLEKFRVAELAKFSPDERGSVEAFITAGASIAHDTFHGLGVRNFCEKTVRWPGFVEFISSIPRPQFTERMNGILNIPVDCTNPDLLWMKVVVSGDGGIKTATLMDLYDDNTGLTAMERCTGFPTALIAKCLARHKAEVGVKTPEKAFAVPQLRQMREELKKHLSLTTAYETAQTPNFP